MPYGRLRLGTVSYCTLVCADIITVQYSFRSPVMLVLVEMFQKKLYPFIFSVHSGFKTVVL